MTTTPRAIRVHTTPDQPNGTVTDANTGETIRGVKAAKIHLTPGKPPEVELTLFNTQVDVTTLTARWVGLENVPSDVLLAELNRRGNL